MQLWSGKRERKNLYIALLFLLPNFLGFLCFTTWPVLLSLFMSFTNWSLKPSVQLEWVWFRNYVDLLSNDQFWFYLYNTFYFMLAIPFTVAGSLFLANLLVDSMLIKNVKKRFLLAVTIFFVGLMSCIMIFETGNKDAALFLGVLFLCATAATLWGSMTFRTMLYVPSFASGVATIILWKEVFNPYHGLANGIISQVLDFLGIAYNAPVCEWLTSTRSLLGFLPLPESFSNGGFGIGAREAIMFMGFWMSIGGNNLILYIAAISNIPQDLFEAAEIDGAGAISRFRHITIPSVAPTTFFISVMAVIGGLQGGFQFAKIMTNGGPAGHTTTLSYFIYSSGFEELNFGMASAVSWLMFILIFGMTLLNWKYGQRRMET